MSTHNMFRVFLCFLLLFFLLLFFFFFFFFLFCFFLFCWVYVPEPRHEKISSSDYPSNQSFSAHARSLSKASCLILWLKYPLHLPLTWTNSTGSGENTQMHRLAWTYAVFIYYNDSFHMTLLNFVGRQLSIHKDVCPKTPTPWVWLSKNKAILP